MAEVRRQPGSAFDRRAALRVQDHVVRGVDRPGDAQASGVAPDGCEERRLRPRQAVGVVTRRPADGIQQRRRVAHAAAHRTAHAGPRPGQIGRGACRERAWKDELIAGGTVPSINTSYYGTYDEKKP